MNLFLPRGSYVFSVPTATKLRAEWPYIQINITHSYSSTDKSSEFEENTPTRKLSPEFQKAISHGPSLSEFTKLGNNNQSIKDFFSSPSSVTKSEKR